MMNPFQVLMDDLLAETKAPKNNRHKGYVALKGSDKLEELLLSFVYQSLQCLVTAMYKQGSTDYGFAKVTSTSLSIGELLYSMMNPHEEEEPRKDVVLGIGNVMLGLFLRHKYIDIYRDAAYSVHNQAAPHIIEAMPSISTLWENIPEDTGTKLLKATSVSPIPKISKLYQGHGRPILKRVNDTIRSDFLEAIQEDFDYIRGVNLAQGTGWRINNVVLDILLDNEGELYVEEGVRTFKGSALRRKEALEKLKKKDHTPADVARFNMESELWEAERTVLKGISKNMVTRTVLTKAKALRDTTRFYQYVELDFRSRLYYQESFLNFQGNDMARGLLLFAEGKPLGTSGFRWLARHIAASYNQDYDIAKIPDWADKRYKGILEEQGLESISVDKMTFEDREMWVWENLPLIKKGSEELCMEAEKPISFLAACIEWELAAGDPEFISHLPIPIDGSCNGYQHSGAIAKDSTTGSLVSLIDQDMQADLYVIAAQKLMERMPDFFAQRPDMKMKHIRKGIAKRGTMTRAYSAGSSTMAINMYEDCYAEGYTTKFNITMSDCFALAGELCKVIDEVCPGATQTMKFLQGIAKFELGEFTKYDAEGNKVTTAKSKKLHAEKHKLLKISERDSKDQERLEEIQSFFDGCETKCTYGNGAQHMEWVTPSGFSVLYECFIQANELKITSSIPGYTGGEAKQPGRIKHVLRMDTNIPDIRGFQAGIAPNYIHSQDASHMSIIMSNWDLSGSFGCVHDSFSVHAGLVDDLASLTRQAFVAMYDTEDTYGVLVDGLLSCSMNFDFKIPPLGDLDLNGIVNSRYFFC